MASMSILPTVASWLLALWIGKAWYNPSVFGEHRMAAMRQSNPSYAPPSKDPTAYLILAALWLVSSMLYTRLVALIDRERMDLVTLSLLTGAGFSAPPYILAVVFEQQSQTVCLIGFGYIMTAFLAMAMCHTFL